VDVGVDEPRRDDEPRAVRRSLRRRPIASVACANPDDLALVDDDRALVNRSVVVDCAEDTSVLEGNAHGFDLLDSSSGPRPPSTETTAQGG
jgi:hypothetical protein